MTSSATAAVHTGSVRLAFRFLLCFAAVWVSACTRPNPDFCCSSPSECSALGVDDDLRACADHKVCDANVCKDIQCSTAAECDGASPYCSNQVCKASCAGDGDCLGAAGPICADDGVCVGCRGNDDCSEAAPICDLATRACAPCRADADCTESGVCLAADGVCAKPGAIVYLRQGGTDDFNCNENFPCKTFSNALSKVTAVRNVIRLQGSTFDTAAPLVVDSKNVYIDAEGTLLRLTADGNVMTFSGTSQATLEGVRLEVASLRQGVFMTGSGVLRVNQIDASGLYEQNAIYSASGTTYLTNSTFINASTLCGEGIQHIERNTFRNTVLDAGTTCTTYLKQNKLSDVRVSLGSLIATNNLIVSTSPTCSNSFSGSGGAEYHFNTWVCRHSPPVPSAQGGIAFACSPQVTYSSNLIAWDAVNPVPNCMLRNSLLPSFATRSAGENNIYVDIATVFLDYLGGDYHLSATSPARGAGDPKIENPFDLEGVPRSQPKGSPPDIGAFESP